MPNLGLGTSLSSSGLVTPGIVTDSLVLKHNYAAGGVVPVSDGAASFDGSSDYVDLENLSTWDFINNFSLGAWIFHKSGGDPYNAIISNYETSKGWDLILDAGVLRMGLRGASGIDTGGSPGSDLRDNKWHYISATCATSAINIYVDGVLQETTAGTWTPTTTSSVNTYIGKRTGIATFNGYICNVGIWDAVLTQPQVKSIMWKNYAGLTSSETDNLVSWWNLDEETATDGTAGSGGVKDHEGSNHGTLT